MASVKPKRILIKSIVLLALCTIVLVWPLVNHHLKLLSEQRMFVTADDSTQAAIVSTYLRDRLSHPPLIERPIYFDSRSAVLCSIDATQQCDEYDLLHADRDGALVGEADISVPTELERLLDHETLTRSYNANPAIQGIGYIEQGDDLPLSKCTNTSSPAIVRISRAVLHKTSNVAIALVVTSYCDKSKGLRVIKFTRHDASWRIDRAGIDGP